MDTREIIDLIPSRETDFCINELKGMFDSVKYMSRDGSFKYRNIISGIGNDIIQISDRFHILANLSNSLTLELKRILPTLITLEELTYTSKRELKLSENKREREYTERYQEKLEMFHQVKEDHKNGLSIRNLCLKYRCSQTVIYKYIRNKKLDRKRVQGRYSIFSKYLETIRTMYLDGAKFVDIHKEIEKLGCTGSYAALRIFLNTREKKKLLTSISIKRKDVCRLLFNCGINDLRISEETKILFKEFLKDNKDIQNIIDIKTDFKIALESQNPKNVLGWITKHENSKFTELNSFVKTIKNDLDAVLNACLYPYSNGIVEGFNCKIKKEKRLMYGRCSFELLRKKILLYHVN